MEPLSNKFRHLVLIIVLCALGGCQTLGANNGLIASAASAELSPDANAGIATEMVVSLTEHLPRGTTTIRLRQDGSAFGAMLSDALQKSGFGLTNGREASSDAIELAYVVSSFESVVMVRLSTSTLDLTRLYRLEGNLAVAASPISILKRDAVGGS